MKVNDSTIYSLPHILDLFSTSRNTASTHTSIYTSFHNFIHRVALITTYSIITIHNCTIQISAERRKKKHATNLTNKIKATQKRLHKLKALQHQKKMAKTSGKKTRYISTTTFTVNYTHINNLIHIQQLAINVHSTPRPFKRPRRHTTIHHHC